MDGVVVGQVSAELLLPMETAARQLLRFLGETRLFVSALGVERAYQLHPVLLATDLAAARDFYHVRLGLDILTESEAPSSSAAAGPN